MNIKLQSSLTLFVPTRLVPHVDMTIQLMMLPLLMWPHHWNILDLV